MTRQNIGSHHEAGELSLIKCVVLQAVHDLRHLIQAGVIVRRGGLLALNTKWPGWKQSKGKWTGYRPTGIENNQEVCDLCEFWQGGNAQKFLQALGYNITAHQIIRRIESEI